MMSAEYSGILSTDGQEIIVSSVGSAAISLHRLAISRFLALAHKHRGCHDFHDGKGCNVGCLTIGGIFDHFSGPENILKLAGNFIKCGRQESFQKLKLGGSSIHCQSYLPVLNNNSFPKLFPELQDTQVMY